MLISKLNTVFIQSFMRDFYYRRLSRRGRIRLCRRRWRSSSSSSLFSISVFLLPLLLLLNNGYHHHQMIIPPADGFVVSPNTSVQQQQTRRKSQHHRIIRIASLSSSSRVFSNNHLKAQVLLSSSSSEETETEGASSSTNPILGFKITMPSLSKTMKEGRVIRWLVDEGDFIESGQPLLEVETDKADMDVEANMEGYLAKILVNDDDGSDVPVGEPLALIACCEHDIDHVISMYKHDKDSYAIPSVAAKTDQ